MSGKKIITLVLVIVLVAGAICTFIFVKRPGKPQDTSVWEGAASFSLENVQTVQKTPGKAFKILQITDVQFDIPSPFKSKQYVKDSIAKLVNQTNPDLIVITGDNVAGIVTHLNIGSFVEIMDSFGIPWAPVFGNHDREYTANLYYQSKLYYEAEHCLFREGPSNVSGVGNYVINVMENDSIFYTLYMLDSHGERTYTRENGETYSAYDYIYPDQIEWYEDNVNGITAAAGRVVPSIAFFHIPLPEYEIAYDLAEEGSEEAELLYGTKQEAVCCPPENTGLFDVMLRLGSTNTICVGHDHVNDFAVRYKGITMAYGLKTGNFSYYDENNNGGTIISVDETGVTLENINLVK